MTKISRKNENPKFKHLSTKIDLLLAFEEQLGKSGDLVEDLKNARKEISVTEDWDEKSLIKSIQRYLDCDTCSINTEHVKYWAKAVGMEKDLFEIGIKEFLSNLYPEPTLSIARKSGVPLLREWKTNFGGYHYGWFQWQNDKGNKNQYYKVLIHVKEIVEIKKMIAVEMMTERYIKQFEETGNWGFKGRMLPISSTRGANFYFEGYHEEKKRVNVVSIFTGKGEPENGLWGIYTAEPRVSDKYRTVPCASRFYMKKILFEKNKPDETKLFKTLGWKDDDEFINDTGTEPFRNEINDYGVLNSFPII